MFFSYFRYDLGVDLPSSGRTDAPTLRDEVNMRYFPLREVFKPYVAPTTTDALLVHRDSIVTSLRIDLIVSISCVINPIFHFEIYHCHHVNTITVAYVN